MYWDKGVGKMWNIYFNKVKKNLYMDEEKETVTLL